MILTGQTDFFEVNAKLIQEAMVYGFHHQFYLPSVNRQGLPFWP